MELSKDRATQIEQELSLFFDVGLGAPVQSFFRRQGRVRAYGDIKIKLKDFAQRTLPFADVEIWHDVEPNAIGRDQIRDVCDPLFWDDKNRHAKTMVETPVVTLDRDPPTFDVVAVSFPHDIRR